MNLDKLIVIFINNNSFSKTSLLKLKKEIAKKSQTDFVRNSEILTSYKILLKNRKIKKNKEFEDLLQIRKIRSLSGVAPIAVLTKPYPCPGKCIYCPTQKGIPKSYLDDEPAVMRARMCDFDAFKQVKLRLNQYEITGHTPEKVELIVMGGTWSVLPKSYQTKFITDCFRACNQSKISQDKTSTAGFSLKNEQKKNEKAKHRIVGLTLETRPDQINEKEIKFMRQLGCTRVEIGVQSIYNDVLKKVKRGHTIKQTIKATKLLKDAGFKVCYHLMPNLPGSDQKKDLAMFKTIFSDERFMPDMIKIYPCVVTPQSELYKWFRQGKYTPYSDKQLINLLVKIKKTIPLWVRINRLYRDIPAHHIMAGSKLSNIRQVLHKQMKQNKDICQCIRCREIRSKQLTTGKLQLVIEKYKASDGEEYFLQYVDNKNQLYALLRLRFPSYLFNNKKHFLPVLQNSAIIREVHAFGKALAIGERDGKIQHQGLGKKLIKKAEIICKKKKIEKLAVISGIGVRSYYKKKGYTLKNGYMVKYL